MLEEVLFNIKYGVNHVLDINAYDHVLFLIVLTVKYLFKDWKAVLWLVSLFTIGHTLSLILAAYNIVSFPATIVEFLIPITILIVAFYNIIKPTKKSKTKKTYFLSISTLFFGLIHGLGFARELRLLVSDSSKKLETLIEFAIGIEIAQLIIVLAILFLGYLLQIFFRVSKRDWIIVTSAIVIGLVFPMLK